MHVYTKIYLANTSCESVLARDLMPSPGLRGYKGKGRGVREGEGEEERRGRKRERKKEKRKIIVFFVS